MKLLIKPPRMINERQELVFKFGFIQILFALIALLLMQCKNQTKPVSPANQMEVKPLEDTISQQSGLADTEFVPIASHYPEVIKQKLRDLEKLNFAKFCIADQVRDYLKRGDNDFGEEFKFIELRFIKKTAEIDSKFSSEISDLASIMNQFPNLKIKLMSYTDNVGDEKANEKLSMDRAEAIQAEMLKAGIAKDRVVVKAYGEKYPVADNKTSDGQLINNRIEMMILSK